jgi:hypothetical protein
MFINNRYVEVIQKALTKYFADNDEAQDGHGPGYKIVLAVCRA